MSTNEVTRVGDVHSPGGVALSAVPGGGSYTDEQAQDAVGAMVDASLTYEDATPLLQRSALTGDVTAPAGSNATTIAAGAVTPSKMSTAARRQTRICRIDAPVAGDAFQVVSIPNAATLKVVRYIVESATNVVFNIEIRGENTPFTAGTDVWTADKTATTGSAESITFDNQPGAATLLTVTVTSVSGTPGKFIVQIEYEVD